MDKVSVAVVVFHGTLCDQDCFQVLQSIPQCDPYFISSEESDFRPETRGIVIPGGFSYGDYIRPGAMAKAASLTKAIYREAEAGKPVIGICNGFQILCELRLLPGALLKNNHGRFICQEWALKPASDQGIFLQGLPQQPLYFPVAHKYGQYYAKDETYQDLVDQNRIAFQYSNGDGEVSDATNPNGSVGNIAGIINEQGNVLGMMPHPERRAFSWNGGEDGRHLFENLVRSQLAGAESAGG